MKYKKAVFVNIIPTHFEPKYWQKLDEFYEKKVLLQRDDKNFLDELKDCDCLLIGFQVDIQKDVIDAAPELKYIGILATAFGTVDLDYAEAKNIPVTNLGSYSTEGVAEFAIALLLYKIRYIEEGVDRVTKGDYSYDGILAQEIKDSKFGVVGLGTIGGRVAELAEGFGANVSYWSRTKKDTRFEYKELDELLKQSDFISLNIAEAEETKRLLNAERIQSLKPGAVIINTVPPTIVDLQALAERLKKGDITYVSDHIDEMSDEDVVEMKDLKNVTLLAPLGITTDGVRRAKQEIFIGNLESSLMGAADNRVN